MDKTVDISGKLALDANSLNKLKQSARENSPEALKAVAKQFEAVLINMMLKSMRDASPQEGAFDNEQSKMFTAMLDQQLSTNLTSKGLGLADILVKQLSKTNQSIANTMEQVLKDLPNPDSPESLMPITPTKPPKTNVFNSSKDMAQSKSLGGKVTDFISNMIDHAKVASKLTGLPAHLMLGQAALETGWGKKLLNGQDGTPSYNLFGIKANSHWKGKVVEATTTEYINGVKQKRIEKFRAYDSYAASFQDFANLIKNTPRYKQVVNNIHSIENYANAMQNAGYATDPHYAKKLMSVIQKVTGL